MVAIPVTATTARWRVPKRHARAAVARAAPVARVRPAGPGGETAAGLIAGDRDRMTESNEGNHIPKGFASIFLLAFSLSPPELR